MEIFFIVAAVLIIILVARKLKGENTGDSGYSRYSKRNLRRCPKNDGKQAEMNVDYLLKKYLSPRGYFVFHNITLRSLDGRSVAQIDHIVVSRYGVVIIETKDWAGNIYGNRNCQDFIQYVGNQKNLYYSPIKQNKKHCEVFRDRIGKLFCKSMIVFTSARILKIDSGDCAWVGRKCELIGEIITYEEKNRNNLTEKEVEQVIYAIYSNNIGQYDAA